MGRLVMHRITIQKMEQAGIIFFWMKIEAIAAINFFEFYDDFGLKKWS